MTTQFEKMIKDIKKKLELAIKYDAGPEFINKLKKEIDDLINKMKGE